MSEALPEVYLARHGETEWTITGQHTGRTDVPLTARGERNALSLGKRLAGESFGVVLTSPLSRARETCRLAGFGDGALVDDDLAEWDYGSYDGKRSADIRLEAPDWNLFRDGCPGGESPMQVAARADRVVARLRKEQGRALIFSHGHFIRVLAARWLNLEVEGAALFVLSTAAVSIVGYEHNETEPAVRLWNDCRHVVE